MKKQIILFLITILLPSPLWAIGGENYISDYPGNRYFTLSASGKPTPLLISSEDYKGVIRALKDLKTDIGKVTGTEPQISYDEVSPQKEIVIAGTVGKSPIINKLVESGKLDISSIKGKWENFIIQVIDNPLPGVEKALVIVGSDKRGTIYGIYDISQKIGVSPWYYWADVPVMHKDAIYVKPGKYSEGPSVKYRGIFINDEAPALSGWIEEKFGFVKPGKNPPIGEGVANYNHEFYTKIFELLLRIKGNYLWPAMWNNAFNEDDPENPRLADEYGIVMGTSHQEPMIRAQQEWDRRYYKTLGHWDYTKHADTLKKFWREGVRRNKDYESIVTMGLRGANDSEMKGSLDDNIRMVENIVDVQQKIISEEMNPDITKVPQMWCLYKEIMEYYNEGMSVPENITLLWADDNWGNVRRLSTEKENKRSGGSGVYYHFDYHGGPRSYEWINTNPIAKIWDQMTLAKEYNADRIWIVNVGHFKGYELPMEYFMDLAWNTDRWRNDNINEYTRMFAEREFGKEYAEEIADILSQYTRFNGRRKPESLSPETYSITDYREAEKVSTDYNIIKDRAEILYEKLPKEKRDAFYQVVLFPVKACAIVNELYYAAARNYLYSGQKRASTNEMAALTRELFKQDTALMSYYNNIYADGRWNHFMDQTHLGYTSWNPPKKNSLNAIRLTELEIPETAAMGVGLEGTKLSWPGTEADAALPVFDKFSNEDHYIEIFNRGKLPFKFEISSDVDWLSFSQMNGYIKDGDKRIYINVIEKKLPAGNSSGTVKIKGAGTEVAVKVKGFNPGDKNIKGFVESGGVVSIEPEHFSKIINVEERKWLKIEDYGLTLSGMRATAQANSKPAVPGDNAPSLEYPVHFFSEGNTEITLVTSPIINFIPDRDFRLAVSIDDDNPVYLTVVSKDFKVDYSNPKWSQKVVNQAYRIKGNLNITKPGNHTLKVWMVDPGIVVQKIIIDTGGLKPSYLGPPESVLIK